MASASVETVGQALLDAPVKSVNNIRQLLGHFADIEAVAQGTLLTSIEALKLFFTDAFANGSLPIGKRKRGAETVSGSAEEVYGAWLSRQYATFQGRLLELLKSRKAALQVAALAAIMQLVRCEQRGSFGHVLFRRALATLLAVSSETPNDEQGSNGGRSVLSGEVLGLLVGKYIEHADVRYHTLISLRSLAAQQSERDVDGSSGKHTAGGEATRPLVDLLLSIPATPPRGTFEDSLHSWSGAAESGSAHPAAASHRKKRKVAGSRSEPGGGVADVAPGSEAVRWMTWDHQHRAFGDAWLAVLKLRLPRDLYQRVLVRMPDLIIPAVPNPLLLSDFLSASVDQGGLTGLLALNGLFVLVSRHGLEYPSFYSRLYGLLTLDAFQASQRVRFFQLVDIFLASPLVPAYTAAAFIKRFARLALRAPPAGAAVCLAFIHNLLRRHPATNQLIHRPPPRPTTLLDDSGDEAELPHSNTAAAAAAAAAPNEEVKGTGSHSPAASDVSTVDLPNGTPSREAIIREPRTATAAPGKGQAAHVTYTAKETAIAQAAACTERCAGVDVYLEAEADLEQCRALESSLWEVAALKCHYDPEVASFTAILDKDLSDRRHTAEVDLQPLLGRSYASRFTTEVNRRLKAVSTAHYATPPTALFAKGALASSLPGWISA